ncbi:hypothetical protein HY498_04565 [Candidatus Woesearchaeota archaeon]|nr:hypothetical protein [Candidatus Woesearchaeota archaeon]
MGGLLYVGGDDSNHAGSSKGEIILATFSFCYKDSVVYEFSNKRDFQKAIEWMKNGRDYRFTLLTDEKYRESSSNLVEIVPHLIWDWLITNKDLGIEEIHLFLDGRLNGFEKRKLVNEFQDFKFSVYNFTKKLRNKDGHISKMFREPNVVYMADVWANMFFRNKSLEQLLDKNDVGAKFVKPT